MVPEEARQLGDDGPQAPRRVEEGGGQGQEVTAPTAFQISEEQNAGDI